MSEALQRVEFDATIDELVDANLRLANRTKSFRAGRQRTIALAAIVPIVAFLATGHYSGQEWLTPFAFGGVFGLLTWRFYDRIVGYQLRKAIAEGLNGAVTIHGEIELRPDEVWLRQHGMQMTFPWSQSADVQDAGDAIELRFTPGLVVARNRFFQSPESRQAFLETARKCASARHSPA